MSEISETEIKAMTKLQNYTRGYKDGKSDVLNKIKAEIIKRAELTRRVNPCNVSPCYFSEQEVLNIIDMYTAESEKI